jgi:hypothetical protein
MARVFTPRDGHQVMNLLVKQATGQQSITVVDSSTFASAGELVLATGMENVLNSISLVLNNLIIASRPYNAKMRIVNAREVGVYSNLARKISFYSKDAKPDGSHNTDLFTNLAAGFTAGENPNAQGTPQSTKSQWEQNPPMPLEMHFGGSTVWQDPITMYEDQIKFALRNDAEWAKFLTGYMQEHANDIESQIEAFSRLVLLNRMGMAYDMRAYSNGSAKDLTAAFNSFYSTTYTGAQLRSTYLKEFLAFLVSEVKADSDFLTERSVNNHWPVPKTVGTDTYNILRHTPKDRQKLALFAPLFYKAEALVLPEIFNPKYLSIDNYEGVTFWQNENSRAAIDIIPAITDADTSSQTYGQQIAGAEVQLDYVVGCLFDEESCLAEMQLDVAETTPLEARKRYRNVWNTYAKNMISDPTEKFILYYMS